MHRQECCSGWQKYHMSIHKWVNGCEACIVHAAVWVVFPFIFMFLSSGHKINEVQVILPVLFSWLIMPSKYFESCQKVLVFLNKFVWLFDIWGCLQTKGLSVIFSSVLATVFLIWLRGTLVCGVKLENFPQFYCCGPEWTNSTFLVTLIINHDFKPSLAFQDNMILLKKSWDVFTYVLNFFPGKTLSTY